MPVQSQPPKPHIEAPATTTAVSCEIGRGTAFRVGLVMEEVVGHAVQARHVRRFMAAAPGVECRYVPVTYSARGGFLERVPVPAQLRSAHRARSEVRRGLAGWKPDALLWNTQNPAVLCLDYLARVPSVISTDVTPLQYDAIGALYGHTPNRPGPAGAMKRFAVTRAYRMASHLVPWTAWVARSLQSDYGVDPTRITVIPPGTDLRRFQPCPYKPSDVDGRVRILFVGGDFERKGGREVLEWFRCSPLAAEHCTLHLVTSATVPAHDNVVVHRLGYDDERLTTLYREADIFVLPTKAECFGISLTEAGASGLPCVTCPVGGVEEIVTHGRNGLLVPPGNVEALGQALEALVIDADLRRRLGRAGRVIAEKRFDYHRNACRLLDILRSVAA